MQSKPKFPIKLIREKEIGQSYSKLHFHTFYIPLVLLLNIFIVHQTSSASEVKSPEWKSSLGTVFKMLILLQKEERWGWAYKQLIQYLPRPILSFSSFVINTWTWTLTRSKWNLSGISLFCKWEENKFNWEDDLTRQLLLISILYRKREVRYTSGKSCLFTNWK